MKAGLRCENVKDIYQSVAVVSHYQVTRGLILFGNEKIAHTNTFVAIKYQFYNGVVLPGVHQFSIFVGVSTSKKT